MPLVGRQTSLARQLLQQPRQESDAHVPERQPATTVVPAEWEAVLSGWREKEQRPLTVREFVVALARLGGHLNRKNDGAPGWLVLWRGWMKLQLLVDGARAAAQPRAQTQKVSHNRDP